MPNIESSIELIEIDWHRNGSGGEGFYAFRFHWYENAIFCGCWFPYQVEDGNPTGIAVWEEGKSIGPGNQWRGADKIGRHVQHWVKVFRSVQETFEADVRSPDYWYTQSFEQQMQHVRHALAEDRASTVQTLKSILEN